MFRLCFVTCPCPSWPCSIQAVAGELSPRAGRIIYSIVLQLHLAITISMLFVRLHTANERRCYFVTPPLNGWLQTYKQLCICKHYRPAFCTMCRYQMCFRKLTIQKVTWKKNRLIFYSTIFKIKKETKQTSNRYKARLVPIREGITANICWAVHFFPTLFVRHNYNMVGVAVVMVTSTMNGKPRVDWHNARNLEKSSKIPSFTYLAIVMMKLRK